MTQAHANDDAAIREQAYLLWEKEGRPAGREMEFWTRAQVALVGNEQLKNLTKPTPKRARAEGQAISAASTLDFLRAACERLGLVLTPEQRDVRTLVVRTV